MISKLDDAFRFHATSLRLREQRQSVLASNMANADTPHYKARDIDFASALRAAMGGTAADAAPISSTSPSHLHRGHMPAAALVHYRSAASANIDGNTVDMDVERTQYADNAVRYEASVNAISGQIRQMLAAIQG